MIQAAVWTFAHRGVSEGSFQAIANRAKVSQSAVFHYFKDKGQLIQACVEHIVLENHKKVSSLVQAKDDSVTQLKHHLIGNLQWGLDSPEQARLLLLIYHLSCFDKKFNEVYRRLLLQARERVLAYLHAIRREGRLKDESAEIETLAILIHDALVGAFVNTLSADVHGKTSRKALLDGIEQRWGLLFQGLFKF